MACILLYVVGENIDEQMLPYHVFEFTELDNEYVEDIEDTSSFLHYFQEFGNGFVDLEHFSEDYFSRYSVSNEDEFDPNSLHKYGYTLYGENGELIKSCYRTNPEGIWEEYRLGGRWNNFLELKTGGGVNQAKKKDIDFSRKKERVRKVAEIDNKRRAFHNYTLSGTDYIDFKVRSCVTPFAVLMDGIWEQKLPLFGESEMKWLDTFDKIWESIDEDELISVIEVMT